MACQDDSHPVVTGLALSKNTVPQILPMTTYNLLTWWHAEWKVSQPQTESLKRFCVSTVHVSLNVTQSKV